jgi:hypothetical protein
MGYGFVCNWKEEEKGKIKEESGVRLFHTF